jgi:hypothetical protein
VQVFIYFLGNIRRNEPLENDIIIMIRAIQMANIPKFLSKDIPIFN